MGIISRMQRAAPMALDTTSPELARFFSGAPAASGVVVGQSAAMRISTYYACVNVLSQDVAKLPLILYRRLPNGGRERATDHPLYRLLHGKPNAWQTSYLFRQHGQTHLAHRGNAYAHITRYRGQVKELLPISPDRVSVTQERDYRLRYTIDGKDANPQNILHVRGLTLDGYTGLSVASWARETLGLAIATERHGSLLFANGALFRGLLHHPGKLRDKDVRDRMRESFDEAFRGDGAHRTALLEDGVKFEKVSMTAEDSQFLSTREFQAYEVARWFRMPPHKVALMKQATFSNIEHQALEFVVDTLLPWLINWEQEFTARLLSEAEQEEYFVEHLVDGLLRGDQKARYEAYRSAIHAGFMSRNEVRARENLNPEEGLDRFFEPKNMDIVGESNEPEPIS